MVKKKRKKAGALLGTKGGLSVRRKWLKVVTSARAKHKCPRCLSKSVKRVSIGLWKCRNCGYTFAGGAYTPTTKLGEAAERLARS